MYTVKAIYDGCNINPIQPIKITNKTDWSVTKDVPEKF